MNLWICFETRFSQVLPIESKIDHRLMAASIVVNGQAKKTDIETRIITDGEQKDFQVERGGADEIRSRASCRS